MASMDFVAGRAKPHRVRWRDDTGKQCTTSYRSKAEALTKLRDVEADLANGVAVIGPQAGAVTLAAWWDECSPSWHDLRPATRARYAEAWRCQIAPHLGNLTLAKLSTAKVQRWVNALVESGLAPATVRKAFNLLRRIMRDAVTHRHVAAMPCDGIRLPRMVHVERSYLEPRQVRALADAMPDEYRALVWVGATGGLRPGELLGLRWRDVDTLHGVIHVRRGDTGPETKTAAGRRTTIIGPDAVTALDQLRGWQGDAAQPGALVFPTETGKVWRQDNFRARVWLPATRAAGLVGATPYVLRHSAIAAWLAATATPVEIAQWAGHADGGAFTLKHYGHAFPTNAGRIAERLAALYATDEGDEGVALTG